MTPTNNKILVRCNADQKNQMIVGGKVFSTATKFETNHREKSPVICEVVEGNDVVFSGDILLCHHNTFYLPSPYHLEDDLFSIPFGKTLFAKIRLDGSLWPICGNLLCDRVDIPSYLPLPASQRKQYVDRVMVVDAGLTKYKDGQLLFTRPYSYYEIVYVWGGVEKRVHKCDSEMICGVYKTLITEKI